MVREIMNEKWRRRTCKVIIEKAVFNVRKTMIPRIGTNITSIFDHKYLALEILLESTSVLF